MDFAIGNCRFFVHDVKIRKIIMENGSSLGLGRRIHSLLPYLFDHK